MHRTRFPQCLLRSPLIYTFLPLVYLCSIFLLFFLLFVVLHLFPVISRSLHILNSRMYVLYHVHDSNLKSH